MLLSAHHLPINRRRFLGAGAAGLAAGVTGFGRDAAAARAPLHGIIIGAASKTLLVTRRRFWESQDRIYGGASYTDLPSGPVYYPSDNAIARDPRVSAGPGVLLASYTLGHDAAVMDRIPRAQRSDRVRELVTPLHPQLRQPGMVIGAVSWSWEQHPLSLGAFAVPGQDPSLVRRIRSPYGRLFFAGEHTSSHPTWMEGALESARRAVREILSG